MRGYIFRDTEAPPETKVWQLTELKAHKPKGQLYVRDDANRLFLAFLCHGCQTCWDYIEDESGDWNKDRVEQAYPHFLRLDEVDEKV